MRSLRRTLSVRFGATMLVALSGLAAAIYAGVCGTLYREFDESLRRIAGLQAEVLASGNALTRYRGLADQRDFVRTFNRLVTLYDSAGQVVARNTELGRTLPLDTAAFAAARSGRISFVSGRWGGERTRAVYLHAPEGSGGSVLAVAAALAPVDRDLRRLLLLMAGTVLVGALATFVGADWLAGASLAPLDEILRQSRGITGRRGGERIAVRTDVQECVHLVADLNEMLERLERTQQWHRRVMRDLGHDLRTPLTAMRAGVEVALWTSRTADEYRRVLAGTLDEVERLTLICDALVLLGRLESGELALDLLPVDLRTIAGEAVGRARERTSEHAFALAQGPAPVPVVADRRLFGAVLDHLLDNAMRHTPPGTRIEVSVGAQDGNGELTVVDDGPGVPDDVLPHLFERFYRGDAARGRGAGPGLGLTMAAAIVERHRGTIAAERGPAGGLRVRIGLSRSE
jgi:two-component system OmpR family sensor kinase